MRQTKVKILRKFLKKEKPQATKSEWRKVKKNYNSLPRPERNKV